MAPIYRIIKFFIVPLITIIVATDSVLLQSAGAGYRGKYMGPLTSRKHSVSGHVYAVDSRTLHLTNFNYDGTGPDAFFWVGFTDSPSPQGIIVPNERGTKEVLTAYNNADITISLPDGLTLRDIKWFAVWCRAYEVNFGDLYIPPNFDFPQPHVIGSIIGQGVSSGPIVVVDAQTILVPDFTYDGQAPDLHFWVGRGSPGPDGIRVPDETGSDAGLAKADKKTLVLSLPGDLTVFDIDYFGVYSRAYNIDYGHVRIQPGLNVPPSLRMLGISPQTRLNCEVLHDESALEIRWSVVGSGETIVFQLVGRIDDGNYMAFGISGESDRSVMLGGDVAVGWFDQSTGKGHVVDYYLERKAVCSGTTGSCPDVHWKEGTNNVRMLSAASINGFKILTYQRKLGAADIYDKAILTNGSQPVIWAVGPIKDGAEAHYHFLRNKDDLSIDFGRVPKWNCPEPEGEPETSSQNAPSPASILLQSTQTVSAAQNSDGAHTAFTTATSLSPTYSSTISPPHTTTVAPSSPVVTTTEKGVSVTERSSSAQGVGAPSGSGSSEYKAPATAPSPASWAVPPIPCYEPDDRIFYAQVGPTGGTYGYKSITGRKEKPQEAWYINGLLLPEINLVRNLNYTFVIQGGDNPDIPSDYNPFYITDDPEGGHEAKSLMERQGVKVYAGVEYDSRGRKIPTAVGKLCRWIENGNQAADFFTSYAAYQRSLFLNCDKGHSGILHFTPNRDTPDLLYYQSYTKKFLGWKIHVVDDCEVSSESRLHPVQAPPPQPPSNIVMKLESQQQSQSMAHAHQKGMLYPGDQSRNPDLRPGETVNHHSIAAPLLPIGDSKTILNNAPAGSSLSSLAGVGSGRPIENAYLFAASPTAMSGLSLSGSVNALKNSHLLQQQQQHMPSIISLDPNRILINGKPIDANQMAHGLPQYAAMHGHSMVSLPGQPDSSFPFPHSNTGFYHVTMDGGVTGGGSPNNGGMVTGGLNGNRIQSQGAFPPPAFQLTDGHIMRRTGPQSAIPHQHQHQHQQSGTNRAPLLPHSLRYDGIPVHSIVYATTGSPIPRVNNNPISYLAAQHGDKHPSHSQFSELAAGLIPGQNPLVRFQDGRMRSPAEMANSLSGSVVKSLDDVKYLEIPSTHNIHMIHHGGDGTGSRIGPVTLSAQVPPPGWTHSRNLPKREQRHPFFQLSAIHRQNGNVKERASRDRDIRANNDLYETGKMNEPTNHSPQSSSQKSGGEAQQAVQGKDRISLEESKGSNNHAPAEGFVLTKASETSRLPPSGKCNSTGNSCKLHEHDDPSNLQLSLQQQALASHSHPSATSKVSQEIESNSPTSVTGSPPERKIAEGGSMSELEGSPSQSEIVEVLHVPGTHEPPTSTTSIPLPETTKAGTSFRVRIISGKGTSSMMTSGSNATAPKPGDHDDDHHGGDELIKNVEPTKLMVLGSSTTTESTKRMEGAKPVYETFSPVFRPSPLDIDGFNVSLNFEARHRQRNHRHQPPHLHHHEKPSQGSGRNMPSSSEELFQQAPSSTPNKGRLSQSQQGLHSSPFPVTVGGAFSTLETQHGENALSPSLSSSSSSSSPSVETLGNSISPSVGVPRPRNMNGLGVGSGRVHGSKNLFAFFPNERVPAGFPQHSYFHDAVKLFNFHRQRQNQQHYQYNSQQLLVKPQEHQQQRHTPPVQFPAYPRPSHKRFPAWPPFPPSLSSQSLTGNGASNPHAHVGYADTPRHSPAQQTGRRDVDKIASRNDVLTPKSPSISIISTPNSETVALPPRISNQEGSDSHRPQLHLLEDGEADNDTRSIHQTQIGKLSSWKLLDGEFEESISVGEETRRSPVVASVSSIATTNFPENEETLSQENLIKVRKVGSKKAITGNGGGRLGSRRRSQRNSTLSATTTKLRQTWRRKEVNRTEEESSAKRAKDDHKAGDGEEDTSPDPLSLTLLTDIWQTINQDNGSKTPSQNPPAAAPPPSSSSSLGVMGRPSLPQRYNFQRDHPYRPPHGNRQIPPPRRFHSGPPPNGGRNRQVLPMPPMRRQPSLLPPSSRHPYGQRLFRNGREPFPV